jgi:ATP-dependent 26S proteasome regulatory subunit
MALPLIDRAAERLAACIHREVLRRTAAGRLPPDPDAGDDFDRALADAEARGAALAGEMRAAYPDDPLSARIVDRLGVDQLELDLLWLAAAAARDDDLAHAIAAMRPPNVEAPVHTGLLASLVAADRDEKQLALDRMTGTGNLARWRLLDFGLGRADAPLAARAVLVPDAVQETLGRGELVDTPSDEHRRLPVRPDPRDQSDEFRLARSTLDGRVGVPLALGLVAPPGGDVRRFAALLADGFGGPLYEIDLRLAPADVASLDRSTRAAARDARLAGGLLLLSGLDRLDDGERERRLAICARAFTRIELAEPVLVIGGERLSLSALDRDASWIELPPTPAEARASLMVEALDRAGAGELPSRVTPAQVRSVAQLYPLPPGATEAAARSAVRSARARLAADSDAAMDEGDLLAAVREQLEHRMSTVADPIRQRLSFDDLVLEQETLDHLREIIIYLSHATTVYDRWGFAAHKPSRGVSALFAGPPGTGKTMAAVVLASELGLELFRIDLSRVVSKYIGETESNLERVFKEATASRAILLFDEADALFGKRTDIKSSVDRYANMEVNYLLQRIESFDGLSILTTNLEKSMDEAFQRRLQFRLRFEKPDDAMRARLWRKLIPADLELGGDVDFAALGTRFEMSGGNIRNAALRAAFLASSRDQQIDMPLLVEAAEREIEQMGRVMKSTTL